MKKSTKKPAKKVTVEISMTEAQRRRLTRNSRLFESRNAYIISLLRGSNAI